MKKIDELESRIAELESRLSRVDHKPPLLCSMCGEGYCKHVMDHYQTRDLLKDYPSDDFRGKTDNTSTETSNIREEIDRIVSKIWQEGRDCIDGGNGRNGKQIANLFANRLENMKEPEYITNADDEQTPVAGAPYYNAQLQALIDELRGKE